MLIVLGIAAACGGRTTFVAPDQSSDAAGSAGAASRGGSSSTGGKTSRGGSFSTAGKLGSNLSGSANAFGGSSTGGAPCGCEPPAACEPGFYWQPVSSDCCEGGDCVLDCRDVSCVDRDCDPGMEMRSLPGDCCPRCLTVNAPPCEEAKKLYEEFRANTLAKYGAMGCSPRGCAIAQESNRCLATCGTPVPFVARDFIEEDLGNFAEETCAACPPVEQPVCLPIPPYACNANECTFAVPAQ